MLGYLDAADDDPDPKPGIDDHRLSRFCAFASMAAGAGAGVVGEGLVTTEGVVVVVMRESTVLLVLADDPVVLGDW
jgi:hypothetical protein